MKVIIENQETSLIDYLESVGIKKATIGITIEGDQATVLIATPDDEWKRPLVVTSPKAEICENINIALGIIAKRGNVPVAKNNAEEIADELDEEIREAKKPVVTTPAKKTGKKATKEEVKKEVDTFKPEPAVEVDFSKVDRYMSENNPAERNLAMAKYLCKELLKNKKITQPEIDVIQAKIDSIDKEIEKNTPKESEPVKISEIIEEQKKEGRQNIIIAKMPSPEPPAPESIEEDQKSPELEEDDDDIIPLPK